MHARVLVGGCAPVTAKLKHDQAHSTRLTQPGSLHHRTGQTLKPFASASRSSRNTPGVRLVHTKSKQAGFSEFFGDGLDVLDTIERELEDLKTVASQLEKKAQAAIGKLAKGEGSPVAESSSEGQKEEEDAPEPTPEPDEPRAALQLIEAEIEAADRELAAKQRALNRLLESVSEQAAAATAASSAYHSAEASARSAEVALEEATIAQAFLRSVRGAKEVGTPLWEALGNKAAERHAFALRAWVKAERDAAMFAAARLADEDKAAEVERLRTLPTAVFMGRLPGTVENEKWSEAMKKIDKGSNDTPGA